MRDAMIQARSLRCTAPAKVNFFLKVLSRRPDGYHELMTWMQKIDLADSLILQRIDGGINLRCPGAAELGEDESNLAYRAARIFLRHTGLDGGVAITLKKHIPVAAGLGGGSSDAAAVLKAMNRLWDTPLDEEALMGLGLSLGADVPFFVANCDAALAGGVGEKLTPRPSALGLFFLLVNPGFPVSTKWVFEHLDLANTTTFALTSGSNPYMFGLLPGGNPHDLPGNDLEQVTMRRYPQIAEIKTALQRHGASYSLMSGSGPTVFGIFEEGECALRAQRCLEKRYPRGVFLAQSIGT